MNAVAIAITQLDMAIFLVAGLIGAGSYWRPESRPWGSTLSWAIIALWAFLKLIRAL